MARLADLRSSVLHEDQKFKSLLEAEQLNEGAIASQRAILAAARAALEAENSDMTLEMRRVMTAVQWRRLETLPPPPPPPPPRPVRSAQEVYSPPGDKVYDVKNTPGIQEPVAEYMPRAAYTPEAKAARIEGTIVLQVVIRKDGSVGDVKVIRGLGYGMDEATIEIIKTKWRFRPGMLNGQPVDVSASVEVSFRLA